jgi:F-type H+-transporting ATPase subunit b
MDSLISLFHIDLKILIAQVVNFGIIFFVLYRFAFKPIAKVMQERTQKIEDSLDNAKEIEKRLADTNKEQTEILNQAKKDALGIVEKADKTAEANRQKLIEKTKEEVAAIVTQEKAKIAQEKAESLQELKGELANLVVLAVEKVINEKMTSAKDQEMIEKIIK